MKEDVLPDDEILWSKESQGARSPGQTNIASQLQRLGLFTREKTAVYLGRNFPIITEIQSSIAAKLRREGKVTAGDLRQLFETKDKRYANKDMRRLWSPES